MELQHNLVLFRLLNKLDQMWSAVPGILHPVLDCLLKFKAVVDGCFSWTLVPDYAEKIKAFSQDYSDLMTYAEVSLQFIDCC